LFAAPVRKQAGKQDLAKQKKRDFLIFTPWQNHHLTIPSQTSLMLH
jgi:hypothetical protein